MPAAKKVRAPIPDAKADAANPALAAVEAEQMGRIRPEGMPVVWPLHALPRRQRTAVKRGLGDVQAKLHALREQMHALQAELPDVDTDESMTAEQRHRAQNIMADMEDASTDALEVMAQAAQQPEAFTAWGDTLEEQQIFDAFAWFGRTLAAGEATGSQTS